MLANGTQVNSEADAHGIVDLQLVPTGQVRATASNLGMSASTSFDPSIQPSALITIFTSYAVIVAIVAAILVAAALTVLVAIQKKRRLMPS